VGSPMSADPRQARHPREPRGGTKSVADLSSRSSRALAIRPAFPGITSPDGGDRGAGSDRSDVNGMDFHPARGRGTFAFTTPRHFGLRIAVFHIFYYITYFVRAERTQLTNNYTDTHTYTKGGEKTKKKRGRSMYILYIYTYT